MQFVKDNLKEVVETFTSYRVWLLALMLEKCIYLQVKWSGVRTQHSTTPFIDEMYERLKETLNDYEVIICRWPEYTFVLENVCQTIYYLFHPSFPSNVFS